MNSHKQFLKSSLNPYLLKNHLRTYINSQSTYQGEFRTETPLVNEATRKIKENIINHRNSQWENKISLISTKDNSLWKMTKILKGQNKTHISPLNNTNEILFKEKDKVEDVNLGRGVVIFVGGDSGVVDDGVGLLVVALVYVTRHPISCLGSAWLAPAFLMKGRVPLLSSSRCSSSCPLSRPGLSSPRRVPRRFSAATWVLHAAESALGSYVGWLRVLGVVASVSVERSRAAASTLESSAAPPVIGVLALAWLVLFVAWTGILASPGSPLPELWRTSALGSPSDCPEVVVAAAGSLGPVDPS